jgi:protein tyrosine/serine phosphatase
MVAPALGLRAMFCINSKYQIEGTSGGLDMFGADKVRVQINYDRQKMFGRLASYVDMLFVDHGIIRLAYLNRHRLGPRAWRCAQPAPHHIRKFAQQGVRTIINLRGENGRGGYWLEQAACEKYGIALVNFKISSRRAPTRERIAAAFELFNRVEYPMLMHCKTGADRTGLMSVLYSVLKEGLPLSKAKRHLSLRYGHLRENGAGIIDDFFDRYLADNRRQPMPFVDWVNEVYDPEDLTRAFRAKGWISRLADRVRKEE